MDQLDRAGEHRHGPSRGARGGGHRRAASEVGRASAAGGGEETRRRSHARGVAGGLPGTGGEVERARRRGVRGADPAHRHGEGFQDDAEEGICGMSDDRRYYGLDALRGGMMMLGIVLHSATLYIAAPPPHVPMVADPNTSLAMDAIFDFIHSFRMPLFFVLAGFFASLL